MTGHDLAAPLTRLCRREFLNCRRNAHSLGLAAEWHPQMPENICDILARDHLNCTWNSRGPGKFCS